LRILSASVVDNFHRDVAAEANQIINQTLPEDQFIVMANLDQALENLLHLIECRNAVLWVVQSIEAMEVAAYCSTFVSVLVIDRLRQNVARLVSINCKDIKNLAVVFEDTLIKLISSDRSTIFFDPEFTFTQQISEACEEILSLLDMNLPRLTRIETWRCTVHTLDIAVVSYAGAHTRSFGGQDIKHINLPGPFLAKQHVMFRRRSFSCLSKFLEGEEAWVLELYSEKPNPDHLPDLYLSTDATTFSDIWGPMWKSCAILDGKAVPSSILRYNVGNGVIIPLGRNLSQSQHMVRILKEEVLCHWVSDYDTNEGGLVPVVLEDYINPDNTLLIGSSSRLCYNDSCLSSTQELMQSLRESGCVSQMGTVRVGRELESETISVQIGAPYIKFGTQRNYKRRGVLWKKALVENWKLNPEGRNVRILEYMFGVEISSCSNNARRRRLITLLGTKTMISFLRNSSLKWNDECRNAFYEAVKNPKYTAFRKLYISEQKWQLDFGNAIQHCLEALLTTGVNERGFEALWVPKNEPARRVNIKSHDNVWTGFLKDTEHICTMAAFEDRCLVMPDLNIGKKCQHPPVQTQSPMVSSSDHSANTMNMSILQTSFVVNGNALPDELIKVPFHGKDDSEARYKYCWRTSLLKCGEKFRFGANGQLKFITSLRHGEIVAKWSSSWDIVELLKGLKMKVQNKDLTTSMTLNHEETMNNKEAINSPLHVLIMSSTPEKPAASKTSLATAAVPLVEETEHPRLRRYFWAQESSLPPRRSDEDFSERVRRAIDRGERGEPNLIEVGENDSILQLALGLVARLPRTESDGLR
jgi:hypothetical protein